MTALVTKMKFVNWRQINNFIVCRVRVAG